MTPSTASSTRFDFRVVIAYLSFIVIGLPGALLGVATPHIRESFGLPLDAIGVLLFSNTIGYFIASSTSGRVLARFGPGTLLVITSIVAALGFVGYILAPSWWVMVVCGVVVGLGMGYIDAPMNIFFAANYGPRLMNWLHACFGIGATLGPLLITEILKAGGVWQNAYVVLIGLYILLAILFGVTRNSWNDSKLSASSDSSTNGKSARATLGLPIVWVGIAVFVIYASLEMIPGQWSTDLFVTARGVLFETAGLWVSIYWASFTVGRIVFGAIVTWLDAGKLVWACIGGALVGGSLYAWNPVNTVGFVGLALTGFFLAPIFALLITRTQERLGPEHAPNAIGFQVAAAGLGIGVLPGLAGVLAERSPIGLEIIPLFFVGLTITLVVLYYVYLSPRLAVRDTSLPKVDVEPAAT